jgi:predicted peptidase
LESRRIFKIFYATEHPERIAALISISGGIPVDADNLPENFCNIEKIPVWAFHGDADDIVSVNSSIESIQLIESNCQPSVMPRVTIFEGIDHILHHAVFNLTSMQNGSLEYTSDPNYDPYDQSIFEWLLSFDLDDR